MVNTRELRKLVRPEDGKVSRLIFSDPEIYQQELERIFSRCWLYVAHETEISNPGDFVTRSMGEEPVIVTRGLDGKVHVLLNTCRHRGRTVCQADFGNAAEFRCPYHGWTYKNTGQLVGVPAYKQAYPGGLDLGELGLYAAPQVDTYKGMIFATWDGAETSLSEYLGGMKWYLDLFVDGTDSGLEVVGPPQRWMVQTNWKFGSGNFIGDAYHVHVTHQYRIELGGTPVSPQGFQVHTENGHGLGLTHPAPGATSEPYFGLPNDLQAQLERHLTKGQLQVLKPLRNSHGTVFPNLSFVHPAGSRSREEQFTSYFTLRQWQPKGPDKIEIWSWCLIEKDLPAQWKETSRRAYLQTFGIAGTTEQDDTETWADITQANRGPIARNHFFHYGMGLGTVEPLKDWPGPGTAYPTSWIEANERAMFDRWLQLMTKA